MNRALAHVQVIRSLIRATGYPNYEAILESTYRRLIGPKDVVIDVGANRGQHTVHFAEIVGVGGEVHAFEPLPDALQQLRRAGLPDSVRIHPFALSDERGPVSFVHAKGRPTESGLKQRTYSIDKVIPEVIAVVCACLDDFRFSGVKFIKMDIEGGEIGCLRGARQTIAADRPWISAEYGRPAYSAYGHEQRTLFDMSASMDYVIGDLFGAIIDDLPTWQQVCDQGMWDWYLIPRERADEWVSKVLA
jgi:FkbM family methyltransferase